MIEGVKMNLGGEDYIVPPLNFKLLRQFETDLKALQNFGTSGNAMAEVLQLVPVAAAAMRRNYPDITDERMTELLDMGNYRAVFEAIVGVTPELRQLLESRLAAIRMGEAAPLPKAVQ